MSLIKMKDQRLTEMDQKDPKGTQMFGNLLFQREYLFLPILVLSGRPKIRPNF